MTVLIVSLIVGKKHRADIVSGLTCLWGSGHTNIINKRRQTKLYERKMRSNKVEYSTSKGPYCNTHDVKVPFLFQIFPAAILYCNALLFITIKVIRELAMI